MICITGQGTTPSDAGTTPNVVPVTTSYDRTDTPSQANAIIQGVNYIAEQIKEYMDSFPPFFPIGHPQRPDMIKQIKLVKDTIKNSSVDPLLKKMVSEGSLSEHSTDKEISTTLDKLFKVKDTLAKDNTLSAGQTKPGTILNVQA